MSDIQTAELLIANDSFYTAFETMDIDKMKDLWVQDEDSFCVHPGWDILRGWTEIKASWTAIFENTGFMRFELSDVKAVLREDSAWISCMENIYTVAEGKTFHSQVAAVNLFMKIEGQWKMSAHHASAISNETIEEFDQGGIDN